MSENEIERALDRITKFLEKWFPQEVAPFVVKKQLQASGAFEDDIKEEDIKLLLSRIQIVVLPAFMSNEEAAQEIRNLKKEINLEF